MKPKDIFGLAVRLLGLLFLYLALKAFTQMLDLDLIQNPDKTDLINTLMPAVFNLLVAVFLLHGKLLTRWAYPETKTSLLEQLKQPAPLSHPESVPPPKPAAAMDLAESKLAALVEKPKKTSD